MKILLLTDSLSLPRTYNGGKVHWEETYVSLLRKKMPDVEFIHVGIGAATISVLLRMVKYYIHADPDIVIIQVGIVDCAPRALSEIEQELLIKVKLITLIKPFTSFLRRFRKIVYTPAAMFRKKLSMVKDAFKEQPLISIGILPASDDYEKKVPGIRKNIMRYNEILKSQTIYIDNADFPLNGITDDYHHMNHIGHQIIYNKLFSLLTTQYVAVSANSSAHKS